MFSISFHILLKWCLFKCCQFQSFQLFAYFLHFRLSKPKDRDTEAGGPELKVTFWHSQLLLVPLSNLLYIRALTYLHWNDRNNACSTAFGELKENKLCRTPGIYLQLYKLISPLFYVPSLPCFNIYCINCLLKLPFGCFSKKMGDFYLG